MGFWIRFAAFVVDWIIVYVAAALTAAVIGISLTSGDIDPAAMDDISIAIENFNYSYLLLFCGMSAVYGVLTTALRGQTLGKMLLRIQVVDANGNIPPLASHTVARTGPWRGAAGPVPLGTALCVDRPGRPQTRLARLPRRQLRNPQAPPPRTPQRRVYLTRRKPQPKTKIITQKAAI